MKYNSGKAGIMLNKWDTMKSGDCTQGNISGKGSKKIHTPFYFEKNTGWFQEVGK